MFQNNNIQPYKMYVMVLPKTETTQLQVLGCDDVNMSVLNQKFKTNNMKCIYTVKQACHVPTHTIYIYTKDSSCSVYTHDTN